MRKSVSLVLDTEQMAMELFPHQVRALAAIRRAVRRGERRMTVVAACGTGKTLIACRAAEQVAPSGAVLVLMPTLALVTQTISRWREAGYQGRALGVCSLPQSRSGLARSQAVMTNDPLRVAMALTAGGPLAVFATYDSLPVVVRAHELFALPSWDLIIADEAHRTCMGVGEGWGKVHDDQLVPAKVRLYMTATPRIFNGQAPRELAEFVERAPTATMDREDVFGPTVYTLGLAKAIEEGILADYQVLMPVVGDDDLQTILAERRPATSAHHDGLRTAAIQVAVLRAMAEQDLRRVLVFHNRVDAAHHFAGTLPATAAAVPAPLRIEKLWAYAIDGEQDPGYRRGVLAAFGDEAIEKAVLCNVRVLNEGVDMPAVDAVVFADPRYSVIDAIQAIGRALRQPPGSGKIATLVIPVYLPDKTSPGKLLKNSSFGALWSILQALRAHDDSYLDRIALPERRPGGRVLGRRLHYSQPERAAELAAALGLQITLPATGTWEEALRAATRYATKHRHLDVPETFVDDEGFALGEWIVNQRLRYLLGRIPPAQVRALKRLGMLWTPPEHTFERMLAHARAYADEHGHLAAPSTATAGGHRVGAWLASCRARAGAGTLTREQEQALRGIDPWWNPPFPLTWRRTYAAAKAHVEAGGSVDLPGDWRTGDGVPLGQWLNRQRNRWRQLDPAQAQLLLELGATPDVDSLYPGPFVTPERQEFRRGLIAAAAYLAREGNLLVPRAHVEETWIGPVRLGAFILKHRRWPQKLTPQERSALEAMRMVWVVRLARAGRRGKAAAREGMPSTRDRQK